MILNTKKLKKAIEFEFNLPYPVSSSMNLVNEAIRLFKQTSVMKIFLLDLNYTLVSNSEIKIKSFSEQILNEEYRIKCS